MSAPTRPPCPCTPNCKGRHINCQLLCSKYKIYRALRDKYYEEMGRIKKEEQAKHENIARTIRRRKSGNKP